MNSPLLLYFLIFAIAVAEEVDVRAPCSCNDLSQVDCKLNAACSLKDNKCVEGNQTSGPVPMPKSIYCSRFAAELCPKTQGCAWSEKDLGCTHFTTCQVFAFETNEKCQNASNLCITDGNRCVARGICLLYKTSAACQFDDTDRPCFWNDTDKKCIDPQTCAQLPKNFESDEACRSRISTCTVNQEKKGCQQSGTKCSDQTTADQCKWNLNKTVSCKWYDGKCYSTICGEAPLTFDSEKVCQEINENCTTKGGGGCTTKGNCVNATIQSACTTNSQGVKCFWTGSSCVDKTCDVLPKTLNTNQLCSSELPGCITKEGGGCTKNGACGLANMAGACEKNENGVPCFWVAATSVCLEKICANAPKSNNTHELCSQFMDTCTVNAEKAGCTTRTCDNAPSQITTQVECNSYLKGCLLKTDGGCHVLTTCAAIQASENCVVDSAGTACFWDGIAKLCKVKSCQNAPAVLTSHQNCVEFLSTCTLSPVGKGCAIASCPVYGDKTRCTSANCSWFDTCYEKFCSNAPSSYDTHLKCNQQWLPTCTVNFERKGCREIPILCSALQSEEQCQFNSAKQPCVWINNSCRDKTCDTALPLAAYATNNACQTYSRACILAKDKQGCISISTPCQERTQDTCATKGEVKDPNCRWESDKCQVLTCSLAVGNSFNTNTACIAYLSSCIARATLDGCMVRPLTCAGLNQVQCKPAARSDGGDCVWTGDTCVEKSCFRAPDLPSHQSFSACQSWSTNCIPLANYSSGCVEKGMKCTDLGQSQCQTTRQGERCYWDGNFCQAENCSRLSANTHSLCQTRSECSINKDWNGCVVMLPTCSRYTQPSCGWSMNEGRCTWNTTTNTCVKATCALIQGNTAAACQSIVGLSCTYRTGANCTDKTCFGDNGPPVNSINSHSSCQAWAQTCSINQAGTGCVNIQDRCSQYGTISDCGWSREGRCFMSGPVCSKVQNCNSVYLATYNLNNCKDLTDFQCTNIGTCIEQPCSNASPKTSHQDCQNFSAACTINVAANNCILMEMTCDRYTLSANCSQSSVGKCVWDSTANNNQGGCVNAPCNTAPTKTSFGSCQAYSTLCSVNNSANDCLTMQATCGAYTVQIECVNSSEGKCKWVTSGNNGTCQLALCSEAPNKTSHQLCNSFSPTCTVNSTSNNCITIQTNCNLYTTLSDCTLSRRGRCQWNSVSCLDSDCSQSAVKSSFSGCQAHSLNCTVNAALNNCIQISSTCPLYSKENCKWSRDEGQCLWDDKLNNNTGGCIKATCKSATQNNTVIIQETCTSISILKCQFQPETSCKTRECSGIYGPQSVPGLTINSHAGCQQWLPTCAINKAQNGCVPIQQKCNEYQQEINCGWSATDGRCAWENSSCAKAKCETVVLANYTKDLCSGLSDLKCSFFAGDTTCKERQCSGNYGPASATTQQACQSWLNTCSINNAGNGCVVQLNDCDSYNQQALCGHSLKGPCFWDAAASTCVDKNCSQASKSITSNQQCEAFLSICTIQKTGGCQDLLDLCSSYTSSGQCVKTKSNTECYWSLNESKCKEKNCQNLDRTSNFATHVACENAIKDCTVRVVDGVVALGCAQKESDCSAYKVDEACKSDIRGGNCFWTNGACVLRTCQSAPAVSHLTHEACYGFLLKQTPGPKDRCTVVVVNNVAGGCQAVGACSSYTSRLSCNIDETGKACFWSGGSCVIKSCSNAPDLQNCSGHLPNCAFVEEKCKPKICEEFSGATDQDCEKHLPNKKCTSNGTTCVERTICEQTNHKPACTTDINGVICEWVVRAGSGYCAPKSCNTAPTEYSTEKECQDYLKECTTKIGGGCVIKTTCGAVQVVAACTKSASGAECIWESSKCRNKECQDYEETSYDGCAKRSTDTQKCTFNGQSKCMRVISCSNYQNEGSCIIGVESPCLWIGDKCIPYLRCESYNGRTHEECSKISPDCTTNGIACVGIAKCSENSPNGCKVGPEGEKCALVKQNNKDQCVSYKQCEDLKLLTHEECQKVSPLCTTNGSNNCIGLRECSEYADQQSCKINSKGKIVDSDGNATSTGNCVWDSSTRNCRDQGCSDLSGLTAQQCTQQLSQCQFLDGKCAPKQDCTQYTDKQCLLAQGPNGKCMLDGTKCRSIRCDEIQDGFNYNICQLSLKTCVSDSQKCLNVDSCDNYKSRFICHQGDKSKNMCTWDDTNKKCSEMNSCESAINDEVACNYASKSCIWKEESDKSFKCLPKDCKSLGLNNCQSFLNFQMTKLIICSIENGICTPKDFKSLDQKCHQTTLGYFTFKNNDGCNYCVPPPTNVSNPTNNNQNQTVSCLLLMGLAIVTSLFV